jgi:hypothetical protein
LHRYTTFGCRWRLTMAIGKQGANKLGSVSLV